MLKAHFLNRLDADTKALYDYSLVPEKFSTKDKVKLLCKRCKRIFEIKVEKHLIGQGCLKCNLSLSLDKFIKRSEEIHGNKYDYDKVNIYNRINNKVEIVCNKCKRSFWQTTNSHLCGKGCPYCAKHLPYTTEEFVKKLKEIFGDKYLYDKVKYKGSKNKVKLFCKKCNKYFLQSTSKLLYGHGCQACSNNLVDFDEFIRRAKKIHNSDYTYFKKYYKKLSEPTKIKCNTCKQIFSQSPQKHLNGQGCPYCHGKYLKTTEQFLNEIKSKRGDAYDYSLVEYKGAWKKVKIICNKCHKEFLQTPTAHLSGNGCPYCNLSKGEEEIRKILVNKNIIFEQQKTFKECKDKRLLPFDFYLPEYNTCIEFQGIQHYEISEFFGGETTFKIRQKHDQIKKDFCKKNNIVLLEIKYSDNIKSKLNEFIINNKK